MAPFRWALRANALRHEIMEERLRRVDASPCAGPYAAQLITRYCDMGRGDKVASADGCG